MKSNMCRLPVYTLYMYTAGFELGNIKGQVQRLSGTLYQLSHALMLYTVEPLNNGTDHYIHYREVVLPKMYCHYIHCSLVHQKVSFIQRCPLFRVSFIGGSTVCTVCTCMHVAHTCTLCMYSSMQPRADLG